MRAKCYVDFEAIGGGADMPQHAILSKAYRVLHGAFGGSGSKYAIAFPRAREGKSRSVGNVIRVFSDSSAELYALLEKVRGHHVMRDYARVSMPQDVPDDFSGEWMSWQRIRVQKKDGINRIATIKRASESPYFEVLSSSENSFPLRIQKVKANPQLKDFTPNSYGLSTGGNRKGEGLNLFSLPVL